MCCFSQPVDYVAGTHIFARPSKDHGQYLVYSMTLKAGSDLSMILPIPTPKASKEDAVGFINLEKYPEFFDDMRLRLPAASARRAEQVVSAVSGHCRSSKLAVIEVGSFVASFVPSDW